MWVWAALWRVSAPIVSPVHVLAGDGRVCLVSPVTGNETPATEAGKEKSAAARGAD